MIADDELLQEFITESIEHLSGVEAQLLEIESDGENINVDLVNDVFRAIHSIKGAAGFLGLKTVNELAHNLENVLNLIRNQDLVPSKSIVDTLLHASDCLLQLIADIQNSDAVDISGHLAELAAIADGDPEGSSADSAPDASAKELTDSVEQTAATVAASENAKSPSGSDSPNQGDAQTTPVANAQPAATAKTQAATASPSDSNLRVSVSVLDQLMNLAGELVLGRNQLLQSLQAEDGQDQLEGVALRLDHVTSELQTAIMKTRMQPVGHVFNRFNRVVRDLSSKLGKEAQLVIEGKDVEVDKTIVEAIGDPLTHLIRNSIDHGLESPEQRLAAGKKSAGTIHLRAYHQSGKVRIEIVDDGKGINHQVLIDKALSKGLISPEQAASMNEREAIRLIFHPGFSMAQAVTDISGRGVGMDVVRSNIEKIGGTVDIETEVGAGTSIIISLPLTLAIIPSLVVESGGYRFAIPQLNIAELVRISHDESMERIGNLKGKEVLRLRGSLLPLVHLSQAIGASPSPDAQPSSAEQGSRNIIVVESGALRYGLVVDSLSDSEEIVVKPLGRHLKQFECLCGATILGDGSVALILDVGGVAKKVSLRIASENEDGSVIHSQAERSAGDRMSVLLFTNDDSEQFAIPMDSVARLERIRAEQIDRVGDQDLILYRGGTLPLLSLEDCMTALPRADLDHMYVVVFMVGDREIGIIAPRLVDIREITAEFDVSTFNEPAVLGTQVIEDRTTRLLDMVELTRTAKPEWLENLAPKPLERTPSPLPAPAQHVDFQQSDVSEPSGNTVQTILLAEDSPFFRHRVQGFLESSGYQTVVAEDGAQAWNILSSESHRFDLILTDIEMPEMDGLEFTKRVRADDRFSHLPIVALTSLAAEEDAQRAFAAGVTEYQIKLSREELLDVVSRMCALDAQPVLA